MTDVYDRNCPQGHIFRAYGPPGSNTERCFRCGLMRKATTPAEPQGTRPGPIEESHHG